MRICGICERETDSVGACQICGYDPSASLDEKLVRRDDMKGPGAFTSDQRRQYILTTTRCSIIAGKGPGRSFSLRKMESIELHQRRHYTVLAILIFATLGGTLKAWKELRAEETWMLLVILPAVVLIFFTPWFLWKDPVVKIVMRDDTVFEDRLFPSCKTAAAAFVAAAQQALKDRRA